MNWKLNVIFIFYYYAHRKHLFQPHVVKDRVFSHIHFQKKKHSNFSLNNIPNNILRKFNKVNVKLSSLTTLILGENDHYFITHKS